MKHFKIFKNQQVVDITEEEYNSEQKLPSWSFDSSGTTVNNLYYKNFPEGVELVYTHTWCVKAVNPHGVVFRDRIENVIK